jgi:hypothetical protein
MKFLMIAILVIGTALAQEGRYREEQLVGTVIADIQHSQGYVRSKGRERERADNALRHLSEFDSEFQRGHFDKDKLDKAIDDVKNLAENNPMSPEDRRLLMDDLARLREFRAHRG